MRQSFAQEVAFELVSEELEFSPRGGGHSRIRKWRDVEAQKGDLPAMVCPGSSQWSGGYEEGEEGQPPWQERSAGVSPREPVLLSS